MWGVGVESEMAGKIIEKVMLSMGRNRKKNGR